VFRKGEGIVEMVLGSVLEPLNHVQDLGSVCTIGVRVIFKCDLTLEEEIVEL
jgi:hypothetical protein